MNKIALITGITGQDGSYLTEFLIDKGYVVHGIIRRSSQFNTQRIDRFYQDPHIEDRKLILHHGDLTDSSNLIRIIKEVSPDEIYNLGAMSHVKVSFDSPEYTANVDALGTLRILEAVRLLDLTKKTKVYHASTSELFGLAREIPQSETTPFYPRSPYGVAKLYAHWIIVNYREAYGMFACNGILFNHESPVRGETFVTRKVTRAVARISLGLQRTLYIGNLNAKRDWGHAKDYVQMMWLMLQQKHPEDFVIATGKTSTIRELCILAFSILGLTLSFSGTKSDEYGTITKARSSSLQFLVGRIVVRIDPKYYRPTEVDILVGDASKAQKKLGWKPSISFESMIEEMVLNDLSLEKEKSNKTSQISSHA